MKHVCFIVVFYRQGLLFLNQQNSEMFCYITILHSMTATQPQREHGHFLEFNMLVGGAYFTTTNACDPFHARCLVDDMFGIARSRIRRRDCDSIDDLYSAIQESSPRNEVVSNNWLRSHAIL